MNKYASGYSALSVISGFGWLVMIGSVFGGIITAKTLSTDMEWVGFLVAGAGITQGLFLFGMAAIGKAILDGSLSQQSSSATNADLLKAVSAIERELHLSRQVSSAQNKGENSSEAKVVKVKSTHEPVTSTSTTKNYKGFVIHISPDSVKVEGINLPFKTLSDAERWIDGDR